MQETILFYGQVLRRWRTTGAVAPSGGALARAMADAVGQVPEGGVIIELGPGTGVFTRELARRFPQAQVVAVEVNPTFAARLTAAVPGVTVVNGCASQLNEHLAAIGRTVDDVTAVVSGLPLLTFPEDLRRRVFASITSVLRPGRRYVQFTYFEGLWRRYDMGSLRLGTPRRVWLNFPPAVVLPFTQGE